MWSVGPTQIRGLGSCLQARIRPPIPARAAFVAAQRWPTSSTSSIRPRADGTRAAARATPRRRRSGRRDRRRRRRTAGEQRTAGPRARQRTTLGRRDRLPGTRRPRGPGAPPGTRCSPRSGTRGRGRRRSRRPVQLERGSRRHPAPTQAAMHEMQLAEPANRLARRPPRPQADRPGCRNGSLPPLKDAPVDPQHPERRGQPRPPFAASKSPPPAAPGSRHDGRTQPPPSAARRPWVRLALRP